jgi:hypothetical protein
MVGHWPALAMVAGAGDCSLNPFGVVWRRIGGTIGDRRVKSSPAERWSEGVVMSVRIVRLVVGVVFALLGILWILQGADLLGGSGGMNGKGIWIVIGAVVLIAGLVVLAPLRRRQHE